MVVGMGVIASDILPIIIRGSVLIRILITETPVNLAEALLHLEVTLHPLSKTLLDHFLIP